MRYASAVTFLPSATGQIQILRTGTGFWRWDHGAPFSIDEVLLRKILYNTRLRARPLRVDFMHWSNGGWSDELENLGAAGEVNPRQIRLLPWPDPATGAAEYGLFCPVSWSQAGQAAADSGLDEISPVIEWEYALPFDATDPNTGEMIKAGTVLGPTITGISLVDQGFFWMDKVRVYAAHGAPRASLYQEYMMLLTPEQLSALLTWMTAEGWDPETQTSVIAKMTGDAADAKAKEVMPEEMPAATPDPAQAAAVLAARTAFVKACLGKNPAEINATQQAYHAALKKDGKAPGPIARSQNPLAQLLAAATLARTQTKPAVTQAAAPPGATGVANYAALEAQLNAQKTITDQLMMKELDREGLLVGIDDPMDLYRAAPEYFLKKVQGNVSLVGSASPASSGKSGLRQVAALTGDENDGDKTHREVAAYRVAQEKAGRRISYSVALVEWEEKNPPKKKVTL